MSLSAEYLTRCAAETGFLPGPLEKVSRLGEMSADIARHPLLKECLLLKGGTALNLCFGAPRRLSVDLDYNYVGALDRKEMLKQRPVVESAVVELAQRHGYRAQISADAFAGRKIYLTYRSVFGGDERLEVDLNFLFRVPLGDPCMLPLWQPGELDRPIVRAVSAHELLAGKLHALLERSAPRDVWDAADLPGPIAGIAASHLFRGVFMAVAATLEHPLTTYTERHLHRALAGDAVKRQLVPMLMSGSSVDPEELVTAAWSAVKPLLVLGENESAFLTTVAAGSLRPELLFPDNPEMARRIGTHPALLWKINNVIAHIGRSSSGPVTEQP